MTNHEKRATRNEKGVILLVVLMVVMVVSIYLPAYLTWSIWDQRGLIRQQSAAEAKALAQAGLNRATLDLYLDNDSWLDGVINGITVSPPDPNSPEAFRTIYNNVALGNGTYTVWIDYLQNPGDCTSGCNFYDKRMLVRSTGSLTQATYTLEQYINWYVVKNLTWSRVYTSLQQAINEALGAGRNNDTIGIAAAVLVEDIAVNSNNWTMQGCYDPTFTFRSCSNYYTFIQGDWAVTGGATVNLSGITID